jgi:hypothetical protein
MSESGSSTPTRLSVALTWMPVQLVLLFVTLAAVDLACQVLGALLVHSVPALVRDAARLGAALLLSAVMIAAYRWLVRCPERRSPPPSWELRGPHAGWRWARQPAPACLGLSTRSSGRSGQSHSRALVDGTGLRSNQDSMAADRIAFRLESDGRRHFWCCGFGRAVQRSYCRAAFRAAFDHWRCLWSRSIDRCRSCVARRISRIGVVCNTHGCMASLASSVYHPMKPLRGRGLRSSPGRHDNLPSPLAVFSQGGCCYARTDL